MKNRDQFILYWNKSFSYVNCSNAKGKFEFTGRNQILEFIFTFVYIVLTN